jgi:hypothetical protein
MSKQMFNIYSSSRATIPSVPNHLLSRGRLAHPIFSVSALDWYQPFTYTWLFTWYSALRTQDCLLQNLPVFAAIHPQWRNNLPCLLHKIGSSAQDRHRSEGKTVNRYCTAFPKNLTRFSTCAAYHNFGGILAQSAELPAETNCFSVLALVFHSVLSTQNSALSLWCSLAYPAHRSRIFPCLIVRPSLVNSAHHSLAPSRNMTGEAWWADNLSFTHTLSQITWDCHYDFDTVSPQKVTKR